MTGPRDIPARFGVPFDYETGQPLSDAQLGRISKIIQCGEALLAVMHECEGSDPGNPGFQSRRMAVANTHLEIALMMAKKACLEAK